MNVVVDGLLTTYTQVGRGQQHILFLHGWADSGSSFTQLAKQLTDQNPQLTATLVDLPGFGATQPPSNAWGLDDYARFVQAFSRKINLIKPGIVGHSNGGAIAIYGLANEMLEADHLILIASAGIRQKSITKSVLKLVAKPAKIVLKLTPSSTQKRLKTKAYGAIGSDYLIAEHMQETFKKVVSTDVLEDARKVRARTTLIYGENDRATPVTYGKLLESAIPDAELRVIAEAGHFVHQEQVYQVTDIITQRLAL